MPFRLLLMPLILAALSAGPPVHAHIVGQDGEHEQDAAEPADIHELIDRMAGQRGDIREQQGEPARQYPESNLRLAPLVQRIIDDELTSDAQRTRLRIFHGQWDALGDQAPLTHDQRAQLALMRYDLEHPTLRDPKTPPLLRAEAALRRGEPEAAVGILNGVEGIPATALRGRAYEHMGKLPDAVQQYQSIKQQIDADQRIKGDPVVVNAAARAVTDLARLEGRPAAEYHAVMSWLGRIYSEIDPYYWPARITEARLLTEKSNLPEAGNTWLEALAINPRSGEAWCGLGKLSVRTYDFARAMNAVEKLREINPQHVLADVVEVRSYLQQKDVDSARKVLEPALLRYPTHRELGALLAATEALAYDREATRRALEDHDMLAPGSPYAYLVVGDTLSTARQYDWASEMLDEAIQRAPGWAEPRLVLGLNLMQKGDLERSREELETAHKIDPFNTRANNQLTLVREMLAYEMIETDHFVIRFVPGVDEVLARDMARYAERYYEQLTPYFGHAPQARTQIDIMPDAEHFAVRITGLPDIWTIAACTGDVLALTPPKIGPKQKGLYDWHNVVGHEYVHTITLSQTRNRIPHWFTEACAVSKETTGRTWDQYQLLAWAYHNDMLFPIDQINWGFIRPKTPRDRPLAYAQAAWMLEYLIETHGRQAMVDLLNLYATGVSNTQGIERVTGDTAEAFFSAFTDWAGAQVDAWGLDQEPPLEHDPQDILDALDDPPGSEGHQLVTELIQRHPDRRSLLRPIAQWTIDNRTPEQALQAVKRYMQACPVDPWPYTQLLNLSLELDDVDATIEALTYLDRIDNHDASHAVALAELHGSAGRTGDARKAIERALFRDPYNADYREAAATFALQAQDMQDALFHLQSLALLEPDRPMHHIRLAAILHRMGKTGDAAQAARRARELDPDARVDRFLPAP